MTKRSLIITSGQEVKMASTKRKGRVIEEVFSLCPAHSAKRLRRIYHLGIKRVKYGHRSGITINYHLKKLQFIKDAFNQEAII